MDRVDPHCEAFGLGHALECKAGVPHDVHVFGPNVDDSKVVAFAREVSRNMRADGASADNGDFLTHIGGNSIIFRPVSYPVNQRKGLEALEFSLARWVGVRASILKWCVAADSDAVHSAPFIIIRDRVVLD